MAEKNFTLTIGGVDFEFNVTTQHFNRYMNSIQADSKMVPCTNFVRGCLTNKEKLDSLNDLIDKGYGLDIAKKLIEEFHPELEIEVKK